MAAFEAGGVEVAGNGLGATGHIVTWVKVTVTLP
jgi:hypothetical protein